MEEENYILFEKYSSKQLSNDEVVEFESKLKTDSEFNQSFKAYKEMSSFLEHKFENEEHSIAFQDNLKTISNSYFNKTEEVSNKKKTSKVHGLYKYAIAACVALLFGVFTFNQFSAPTYSDFSNHETISLTVRGNNNDLLKLAESAFNSGNYAKAEDAFRNLIKLDDTNVEYKLYRAISNIEINNFEIADNILEHLSKGQSVYKNKASWYLALSKLKQDKIEACVKVLKTIPVESDHYDDAKKVLKKLD